MSPLFNLSQHMGKLRPTPSSFPSSQRGVNKGSAKEGALKNKKKMSPKIDAIIVEGIISFHE